MGAYNPNTNLLAASIDRDTTGLSSGITAAGQAIAGGIEQYSSFKAAATAADAEFDMFQKLYPDAAALMDPEKFHSANLAGKQKILGLGKGYILEQQQKSELMQKQAMQYQELGLRAQDLAQRGGYQNASLEQNRQELMQRAAESQSRSQQNNRELDIRESSAKAAAAKANQPPALPRYVPVGTSGYKIPVDGNGNRIGGLPALQSQRGPFAGGLSRDVPVADPRQSRAPAPITRQTPNGLVQWDEETREWIPAPMAGPPGGPDASLFPGGSGAPAGPAGGLMSRLKAKINGGQ